MPPPPPINIESLMVPLQSQSCSALPGKHYCAVHKMIGERWNEKVGKGTDCSYFSLVMLD